MYIKINNILNKYGVAEYKGIDLNKVIPMSQRYNFESNECVLEYSGIKIKHEELKEITEEEYNNFKTGETIKVEEKERIEKTVQELQKQIQELQQSNAELMNLISMQSMTPTK